jgi:transcriptional regulator with XRE-family HTH domain
MNIGSIGQNIRKLREERSITQQQLADALGVSFQAVSKWECGTTVPDIGMLPLIAEYFDIAIDDLFKAGMTAYRHKAQRLLAQYESDIRQSEIFELADREYVKLISENKATSADLGQYAYLNDLRAQYYLQLAETCYVRAIEEGETQKDETFYKNQRQYVRFLARQGRHQENIERHTALLEQEPDNPMNYSSLAAAYQSAGDYEKAAEVAGKGLSAFPNDVMLLISAGDSYKQLGKFDQAIACWNKAFEADPEAIDTRYSLAFYYLESGQRSKAKEVLLQIKEWNHQRGYYMENKWVNAELKKLEDID